MKNITLYHLFLREKKQIGIKFFPDKIIQLAVKSLPNVKWSEKNQWLTLKTLQKT